MPARVTRAKPLTDAQLLLLGLIAEMPRHGYELEREIDRRGMREWTRIGFSSIYFVLGGLERARLVSSTQRGGAKARKTFAITAAGRRTLAAQTIAALRTYRPTNSSVLLGMINFSTLERGAAIDALAARAEAVDAELARLETIRVEQQPLPDHVDALFDFSIGQLAAEAEWIERTHAYMRTRPWLE